MEGQEPVVADPQAEVTAVEEIAAAKDVPEE